MSEKGASEGVDPTLVQIAPDEVVVEREPVHHGREDVGHGGVGHLGVLDVKDRRPLRSEGRGVEFAGFVEDWAGKEEAGSAVFTSGECVVVALGGGDGSIGGPGAGFSGGALGGSGSDYLERGFVEEINSPNQGLEGRVGEGDFLFEVSGNPLRGEEYGVGEDGAAERGENLLSPEGDLVGNDSGLNGEGPQDDVVEPPAAALEIVLEAVNVALVDGSTDCRFHSKDTKPGETGVTSAWVNGMQFLLGPRRKRSGTESVDLMRTRATLATSRGRSSGRNEEGSFDPWTRRRSCSLSSESGGPGV